MHHHLLVELLGERAARREHRRSELAFLAEDAVRHADIRVDEGNGLPDLDGNSSWSKGLHRAFFPNARARQHFDGRATGSL